MDNSCLDKEMRDAGFKPITLNGVEYFISAGESQPKTLQDMYGSIVRSTREKLTEYEEVLRSFIQDLPSSFLDTCKGLSNLDILRKLIESRQRTRALLEIDDSTIH